MLSFNSIACFFSLSVLRFIHFCLWKNLIVQCNANTRSSKKKAQKFVILESSHATRCELFFFSLLRVVFFFSSSCLNFEFIRGLELFVSSKHFCPFYLWIVGLNLCFIRLCDSESSASPHCLHFWKKKLFVSSNCLYLKNCFVSWNHLHLEIVVFRRIVCTFVYVEASFVCAISMSRASIHLKSRNPKNSSIFFSLSLQLNWRCSSIASSAMIYKANNLLKILTKRPHDTHLFAKYLVALVGVGARVRLAF